MHVILYLDQFKKHFWSADLPENYVLASSRHEISQSLVSSKMQQSRFLWAIEQIEKCNYNWGTLFKHFMKPLQGLDG